MANVISVQFEGNNRAYSYVDGVGLEVGKVYFITNDEGRKYNTRVCVLGPGDSSKATRTIVSAEEDTE